jgi:hypothetical protein
MDQLKKVLKFRFWILLGIALILPVVGWFMATSGLVSEAEGRTKSLKDLTDKLKVTTDDPNKDWETGLEAINVLQAEQPKFAQVELYKRQVPLMIWPPEMPNDPAKIQPKHQEFYRTGYAKLVEEVRKVVKPYDEESQTGLIDYDEGLLPRPDRAEWVSSAPSIAQIVAAQEDIWLLSSILAQIAAVNEDEEARNQFEAPIRQIIELYLRGGSIKGGGSTSTKSSSGGGAGAPGGMKKGMEEAMTKMSANMLSNMSGAGMQGGMVGGGGAASITSAKLNPDEDLGPEVAAPVEKAAEKKTSSGTGKVSGGADKMLGHMPTVAMPGASNMPGSSAGARWSLSTMQRYREDKPEFRTRGFYLEVVMDHRRIPDLLTSLANADWPIAILRVQESDYKDEDLAEAGEGQGLASMGSGRSMGMGGMIGGRMGGGGGMLGMGGAGGMMKSASSAYKGSSGRSSDVSGDAPMSISNRSPLDDPNLSNVAIVGVIYVFKKPEVKPGTTTSPASPPVASPVPSTPPLAKAPANGATGSNGVPGTTNAATVGEPPNTEVTGESTTETVAGDEAASGQAVPSTTAPQESTSDSADPKEESPGQDDPEPEKSAPNKS